MLKSQRVTLHIVYDDQNNGRPSDWAWQVLLDLDARESVDLIDYTAPIEEPDTDEDDDD